MKYINYRIKLLSDAENASGLGNELVNSRVPRNANGRIIIPATHIKGLLRENLEWLFPDSRFDNILAYLFGNEEAEDLTSASVLYFSDAVAPENITTLTVSRTAIGKDGIAQNRSLRVTEAVPRGTVFEGSITLKADVPSLIPFIQFALLTLYAVGGKRNRGAGQCLVTLSDTPELKPDQLASQLNPETVKLPATVSYSASQVIPPERTTFLRLRFQADAPLCLPENPLGECNVIKSGFAIPGTAVTGMLLGEISKHNPQLASALFNTPTFRCWPLHPAIDKNQQMAYRISSTHKISKLKDANGRYIFADQMIQDCYLPENYRWEEKAKNTALKGCDGTLSCSNDGIITLWRSAEMPRLLSAHGVHCGSSQERNLFTKVSLAVANFIGLVALPASAASDVLEYLHDGVQVFVGKARSVQGQGTLYADQFEVDELSQVDGLRNRLFIVQSPLLLPEQSVSCSAEDGIRNLICQTGNVPENVSGAIAIRFGWNSMGIGEKCSAGSQRIKARRVVAPGSVFLLEHAVQDLEEFLARGLGKSEPGFGAVLPHPGIAAENYANSPQIKHLDDHEHFAERGYKLYDCCRKELSPSQIAALISAREQGIAEAKQYLNQQIMRTEEIRSKWENAQKFLDENRILDDYDAVSILKVWHDLAVMDVRKGR